MPVTENGEIGTNAERVSRTSRSTTNPSKVNAKDPSTFDTAEVYGTRGSPHDNEELIGAADLKLTDTEVAKPDEILSRIPMSAVFEGTKTIEKSKKSKED